ncbi:MAG: DNA gyrase subunit A [Bacteroidaceae bacterium]|nr:DNA gyrase subunit A [Bacteroidaceae bacterium]
MEQQDRIIRVNIEEEMKSSYIDYSMSVIVARALPDARDGLKPVHRRILYSMMRDGNTSDKGYRKSARTVGDVLGHFHPHGDSSVYGALVRLAQDWIMRYPLVDGQGNFGSIDGDSPAAMRYTEVRLRKIGEEMMQDINKNTVNFEPNYDNKEEEPTVLPACIPNLLVNGSSGIAVGMATNMPPHNLTEVLNGCMAMVDNPEISVADLMQYIKGPDFPTGAYIYGMSGVREAYETGRGRVIMRAKAEIEAGQQHDKIVVTEIPYGVNKAELIKFIAQLVTDKKIDGISNVNDETDREGMRIVIDVKRDANANVVLNKLFKMTALQTSFGVNNIALVNGRPKCLNLRELIKCFIDHRHEVVIRRTKFDLEEAKKRAHILEGLIIASDNIDEVIRIIKTAKTPNDAIQGLMDRFGLDDIQAKAIVDMRLRQLTGLMQDQLHDEYNQVMARIEELQSILDDPEKCKAVIKGEMQEIIDKYGDERKTEIVLASEEFNPEDFYADEPMIITMSHLGYIKRTALAEYRLQGRGGVGSKGSDKRDEDFIEHIFTATTHNFILFFTQKGRCFWLKVYDIPEGGKTSKGRAIQNMLNIESDDAVTAYIAIRNLNDTEFIQNHYLLFCTRQGIIKKTILEDYSRPRQNGINAIKLNEGDMVINVLLTDGNKEIIIANRNGRAIRFNEQDVRPMGRTSTGVTSMQLDGIDPDGNEDYVVGILAVDQEPEETIMVISEEGYGKRSEIEDYRKTSRRAKGVKTLNVTEKTGKLVSIQAVTDDNDLIIINKSGITLRLDLSEIRVMGRATQGVRLINLEKRNDHIASVCKVDSQPEVTEVSDAETGAGSEAVQQESGAQE